jgi:hypothetical protein
MTRSTALLLCVGVGLRVGAGSTRSAPRAGRSSALSFAPSTGVVTSASRAAVIVDRSAGTFLTRRRGVAGPPKVAVVDAIGDLNGDGRPDLVTHFNQSDEGDCPRVDGVEVCTAYAYVSLTRRNGTFRRRSLVYSNDSADIASAAVGDVNGDGGAISCLR